MAKRLQTLHQLLHTAQGHCNKLLNKHHQLEIEIAYTKVMNPISINIKFSTHSHSVWVERASLLRLQYSLWWASRRQSKLDKPWLPYCTCQECASLQSNIFNVARRWAESRAHAQKLVPWVPPTSSGKEGNWGETGKKETRRGMGMSRWEKKKKFRLSRELNTVL